MPDKTISMLEVERYTHIECRCRSCRNWVAVPFDMIRRQRPRWLLSAITIEDLGKKMPCGKCGSRDVEYKPMRQEDAPGYAKRY
ncbi:hypothetical protein SAMN05216337_1017165 [Bradyrhizobium brasilense]|uniref:Uncharacterized protein n=1 Tax=Bradyrhizobium brasilense TaxID=1419277 RepID=A0A1G6Z0N3_9BRAD|nr:hypothetical protein [Bradyrhizobium brasilense]SDD96111.1 hypothetical protein SAMN05216337_1017165 [Bradyrhizobium brasilense]